MSEDYTTAAAADADGDRIQVLDVTDHALVVIVGKDGKAQVIMNCSLAQAASYLESVAVSVLERSILGEIESEENLS